VVGYPIGGDTISVTSGVVSRIEVLSSHPSPSKAAVYLELLSTMSCGLSSWLAAFP